MAATSLDIPSMNSTTLSSRLRESSANGMAAQAITKNANPIAKSAAVSTALRLRKIAMSNTL